MQGQAKRMGTQNIGTRAYATSLPLKGQHTLTADTLDGDYEPVRPTMLYSGGQHVNASDPGKQDYHDEQVEVMQ